MPPLSRWFVRTALLELTLGFLLGAAMLATKGSHLWGATARLLPLHIELMLPGWLANLAIGVAYWMLPKHAVGAERGAALPVALAWLLLNGGILLVGSGAAVAVGRSAEFCAVVLFTINAWPRIKRFGAGRPGGQPSAG
ncbi:MAG TPA: hypothetical protein VFU45_07085 [Gemmatimonadales bacterium]|nr:hypothetical protein [Gemmatimonadales bacterium]